MLHKTGIHLFLLRNMLRSCSKLKETSFLRIFYESAKLRRIWFVCECYWKVENKLILTRWKACNEHLCYKVENSEMFTCKENFFGVAFSTVVSEIQFFCAGSYFKNQRFTELQRPVFTKKRSRTNKRTAIKKTCLFFGLSKEPHLT